MHKLSAIIRHIFVLCYMIYAVSPMIGDVDRTPPSGLNADRTTAVVKLLIVDRIIGSVFDVDNECTATGDDSTGDDNAGDDFLVKKFRSLPGGRSLDKQIFSESHAHSVIDESQMDFMYLKAGFTPHDIFLNTAPAPFEGYGTLHSGLAPPHLFS